MNICFKSFLDFINKLWSNYSIYIFISETILWFSHILFKEYNYNTITHYIILCIIIDLIIIFYELFSIILNIISKICINSNMTDIVMKVFETPVIDDIPPVPELE